MKRKHSEIGHAMAKTRIIDFDTVNGDMTPRDARRLAGTMAKMTFVPAKTLSEDIVYKVRVERISTIRIRGQRQESSLLQKKHISHAMLKEGIAHSYMTMEENMKQLSAEALKRLSDIAGLEATTADGLWAFVKKQERDKPRNLTMTELNRILAQQNIGKAVTVDGMKQKFKRMKLPLLRRIARAKKINCENQSKKATVAAIFRERETYHHRLKAYKVRESMKRVGTLRSQKSIKAHLNLMESCADRRVEMMVIHIKPFIFYVRDLWLLSYEDERLTFAPIATLTTVECRRRDDGGI